MKSADGMIGYTSPAKAMINMTIATIQPIISIEPSPLRTIMPCFQELLLQYSLHGHQSAQD